MAYQGDILTQQTLYFTFTTNSAGVPTTLAGTPALSIYQDDSTTQTTTGITLVVDLDGVTGLHSVKIVTTDAFYAVAHDYSVVITTGTVGGVSAVGYVVGSFSIQNRYDKQTGDAYAIVNSGTYGNAAINTKIGTPLDLGNGTATLAGNLSDVDGEIDTIAGIVGNLGNVGSPTYSAPSSYTLTTGNQTSGTYANVDTANQVYHVHTDAAGVLSLVYHYTLRPDEMASSVIWKGRWNGTNDTLVTAIYDWVGAAYVQLDSRVGVSGTTSAADWTITPAIVAKYTSTAANGGGVAGKVDIRISGTGLTSCTLSVDQLILGVSNNSRTVGYSDGAVWLNTAASNTNTVSFVDGTADNPVSTIAAALTIASALNIKHIHVANGSSFTLGASLASISLAGNNWTLALGGQAITDAYIEGATISGVSSGTGAVFVDCHFTGTQTVGGGDYYRCGFGVTTFTMLASSLYNFVACFDDDPDTATSPIFVFAASVIVGARNWRGAFQCNSMASTNKLTIDGAGRLILADTSVGGAITVRGFYPPIAGGAGLHTAAEFVAHGGTLTQTSRYDTDQINAEVDTALADYGGSKPGTAQTISDNASITAILADTNDLQTNQGNWLTATGFSTHSAADVWSVTTRTLSAFAFTPTPGNAADTTAIKAVTDQMKFTVTNQIDANALTGGGGATAADVRIEMDAHSTQLAAIVEDTGTTLPAQITGLNNISQADVRTAVGLATANLDTQIAALPTDAENAAAVLAAAIVTPIESNVKQVNDVDLQGTGTAIDPWEPA